MSGLQSSTTLGVSADSILQRAFELTLSIQGEKVVLLAGGRFASVSAHTLAILDAFATPKTLAAGLQQLSCRSRGLRDWIRLNNQVLALVQAGILVEPDSRDVLFPSHSGSFSSPDIHIRMLNDQVRTLAYQQALREVVRPGDVVVDVGTGTGVLAASAALAGARQVYAVERTGNMPKLAREFFRANGLDGRITLIEGDSTGVQLPEPADVMVSEIIGNDPLAEGIVSTTADARRRLLASKARIIPSVLRLYALPLTAPDALYQQAVFTVDQAENWRNRYGLDFSGFVADCSARTFTTTVNTARVKAWPRLAAPILLESIDLAEATVEAIEVTREFAVEASGQINCIVLYFEAQLSPAVCLSVHPDHADAANSWASWAWLPGQPLAVRAGQRMRLNYRFDVRNKSSMLLSEFLP